jgi:hypothetical protein
VRGEISGVSTSLIGVLLIRNKTDHFLQEIQRYLQTVRINTMERCRWEYQMKTRQMKNILEEYPDSAKPYGLT